MRDAGSQFTTSHTYTVREMLFTRGMAKSYLAHDEHLDDDVVIEHVEGPLGEDTDWVRQYRSVAVRVMRLRHPNLIVIRDFWTDYATGYFLVKQYDPGTTLDALLSRGHIEDISLERRVGLCKDLLRGLAALHAGGVIHRDIKPYGIYVSQEGDWRAQVDHYHVAVLASGAYLDEQLSGTPVYMAPELIPSEPRPYTRQSDVYAAGLVILEILSGKKVQELLEREGLDLAGGRMALLSEVCARGGHVRQEVVREVLPAAYAEAVCRAVRADPAERFADGQCFLEALESTAPVRR